MTQTQVHQILDWRMIRLLRAVVDQKRPDQIGLKKCR